MLFAGNYFAVELTALYCTVLSKCLYIELHVRVLPHITHVLYKYMLYDALSFSFLLVLRMRMLDPDPKSGYDH